ncbi:hypothetical protein N656DRAFT_781709 [Canariomyces notabilis]|uniref:Secondary alcohol dehydrogenase n=1 Tax=Canariomyces notabilis TaxID=2074819 RepID=A0AAN6T9U4_9PEZI|nr:hypothetical protein N656DRAFT_781709 [Canariomyces arenarius]
MSADARPITPAAFAAALKDLPLSSLRLKVAELRNSIAHLDYSNEQLRPFADGTATAVSPSTSQPQPQPSQSQSQSSQHQQGDQDCIDAIRENEEVIERMQERIRLVRAEVEERGFSWAEFQSEEERKAEEEAKGEGETGRGDGEAEWLVNGNGSSTAVNGVGADGPTTTRHAAWSDGTFQTGSIRDGVVHMDSGERRVGGSLTDEELRRRMEEQLRDLGGDGEDEDREGGLHL